MSEEINKECPLCLGTGYAYQELGLKSDGSNCVLCSGTGVLSHSAKYAKLRSQLTWDRLWEMRKYFADAEESSKELKNG